METKTATPDTARVTTHSPELVNTTLREILGIPDTAMDQAMGIAYQLYLTGRLPEAETICKGLIACDHRYWWSHSLHASVLRRLGRCEDALAAVEEGLKYEPGQAKLSLMRAELLITIARNHSASAAPTAPNTATRLATDLAQGRSVQIAAPTGL